MITTPDDLPAVEHPLAMIERLSLVEHKSEWNGFCASVLKARSLLPLPTSTH